MQTLFHLTNTILDPSPPHQSNMSMVKVHVYLNALGNKPGAMADRVRRSSSMVYWSTKIVKLDQGVYHWSLTAYAELLRAGMEK